MNTSHRIACMSDIHGNLPALEALAASLPECDAVYVAGDHCLDGPCPSEVLDFLLDRQWHLILGNTDQDLVSPPLHAKPEKAAQIEWTRSVLGTHRLAQLAALSFSMRYEKDGTDGVLVVHANPITLDDQLAPGARDDVLRPYFANVSEKIIVFGHIHIPYIRPFENHVLIDVSSVGHPKDHDRRAAYTLLSWENGGAAIQQVRVPYDLDRTRTLLLDSGMPGAQAQVDSLFKASY